ncbi:MAG: terminase family protein [Thermonemataceae bacterium]|nr:terminase family protein [Thermonemataceae bacterium]
MAKKNNLNRLFDALDEVQGIKTIRKETELPPADFEKLVSELSEPQRAIFKSTETINLFLGGQGSGKTYLAGLLTAYLVASHPEQKGLIAANTYAQLSGTTLFRIREVWKSLGWIEYNEYTKEGHYTVGVQPPESFNTQTHNFETYRNIISFCNGTVVHYHSLDNYKPIDGLEISWACLDETKDTRPEAITEVILGRLRQKNKGANKLYVFTSPSKNPFLNEFFNLYDFETEIGSLIYSSFFAKKTADNKFAVVCSALHNLKHLPEGFIERQKKVLPSHLQDMLIYGNPFAKGGGEFYKGFDRSKHTGKCIYQTDLPLHITFDFNVNPYVTLCVWQIKDKQARQLTEICLKSPRNNTKAVCREFSRLFTGHQAGLFVYGDPAGKHQDTRNQKGYNDFTIIQSELKGFRPSLRVAIKAPAVVMRANFINTILEQELYDISILIDESCKNTLADYTFLKEAADGTKHKEKTQENGISFEKYGHCSDANDYFLCEAFKNEFDRYLRGDQERKHWLTGMFQRTIKR